MKPFDYEAFKNGAVAIDKDNLEIHYVGTTPDGEIAYSVDKGSGWRLFKDHNKRLIDQLVGMKSHKTTWHFASYECEECMVTSPPFSSKEQLASEFISHFGYAIKNIQYHTFERED